MSIFTANQQYKIVSIRGEERNFSNKTYNIIDLLSELDRIAKLKLDGGDVQDVTLNYGMLELRYYDLQTGRIVYHYGVEAERESE